MLNKAKCTFIFSWSLRVVQFIFISNKRRWYFLRRHRPMNIGRDINNVDTDIIECRTGCISSTLCSDLFVDVVNVLQVSKSASILTFQNNIDTPVTLLVPTMVFWPSGIFKYLIQSVRATMDTNWNMITWTFMRILIGKISNLSRNDFF